MYVDDSLTSGLSISNANREIRLMVLAPSVFLLSGNFPPDRVGDLSLP